MTRPDATTIASSAAAGTAALAATINALADMPAPAIIWGIASVAWVATGVYARRAHLARVRRDAARRDVHVPIVFDISAFVTAVNGFNLVSDPDDTTPLLDPERSQVTIEAFTTSMEAIKDTFERTRADFEQLVAALGFVTEEPAERSRAAKPKRREPEAVVWGSPRHDAICRALRLAHIDPDDVSLHGVVVHRNHIEFDEVVRDANGDLVLDVRRGVRVTRRRIVRNPNPRLALSGGAR